MLSTGRRRAWSRLRQGALTVVLTVGLSACQPLQLPSEVQPAPEETHQVVANTNAGCVECHVEIGAEWSRSLHAQSYVDPVFQSALSIEPTPFCRGCHAPLTDPLRPPPAALADIGVACLSCHTPHAPIAPGVVRAPLTTRRPANPAACASCHQFDFPERPGVPMQDTLMEHQSSAQSGVACQTCHMPIKGERPHLDHEFRVSRNPEILRRSVSCNVERSGPAAVRFQFEAADVGHSVPTGDIFRRLELRTRAWSLSTSENEEASPVVFARRAEPHRIEDTRVPAPGLGVTEGEVVFARIIAGFDVEWALVYLRMSPTLYQTFGMDAEQDAIVLCSGTIAAEVL